MELEKYPGRTDLFKHGDEGDKFYIILKGKVSISIPNPLIKKWKEKYELMETLNKWKSNKFDL
jgi:CRP-like cAMP-binding protein